MPSTPPRSWTRTRPRTPNDTPANAANSALFLYRDGGLLLGRRERRWATPSRARRSGRRPWPKPDHQLPATGPWRFSSMRRRRLLLEPTRWAPRPPVCGFRARSLRSQCRATGTSTVSSLDGAGNRDNRITVIDLVADAALTYTFASAPTNGGASSDPCSPTRSTSPNKQFLLYDALYVIKLSPQQRSRPLEHLGAGLHDQESYSVISPYFGFDIFFPSTAHANGEYYTFEVDYDSDGTADV